MPNQIYAYMKHRNGMYASLFEVIIMRLEV